MALSALRIQGSLLRDRLPHGRVQRECLLGNVVVPRRTRTTNLQKVGDAFLAAMEKHAGGVTAEQKKVRQVGKESKTVTALQEWEALFAKAYGDMKTWGWY